MVDNADLQMTRRKIRDRSVALLVVGTVLLMPPLVRISLIDETFFGLPFALVYLFSVWALLVVGSALLAKPLRDSDKGINDNTTTGEQG
jgi:hypothetical protein